MPDYTEIAKKMESGSIVKASVGDYVIYRRDYLHENYEHEYILQKSAAEFARKFGKKRHRNLIESLKKEIKGSRGT